MNCLALAILVVILPAAIAVVRNAGQGLRVRLVPDGSPVLVSIGINSQPSAHDKLMVTVLDTGTINNLRSGSGIASQSTSVAPQPHVRTARPSMRHKEKVNPHKSIARQPEPSSGFCFITLSCVRPRELGRGVAGYILAALPQIKRCTEMGRTPMVHWDDRALLHSEGPVSCGHLRNCWEHGGLQPMVSSDILRGNGAICLDSISEGTATIVPLRADEIFARTESRSLVAPMQNHVRLKESLRHRVDEFHRSLFQGVHVLGVQVRATDYFGERSEPLVPSQTWVNVARRFFNAMQNPKRIFIASDNHASVQFFVDAFGKDTVIHTNASRAHGRPQDGYAARRYTCQYAIDSPDPWLERGEYSACLKNNWEGVLEDIWLLARCERLVYWEGSVAKLAMLLNPSMPVHRVVPRQMSQHLLQSSDCAAGDCARELRVYGLRAEE